MCSEVDALAFEMSALLLGREEMSGAERTVLAISSQRLSPVPRPKSNKCIKRLNPSDPSPKRQRRSRWGRQTEHLDRHCLARGREAQQSAGGTLAAASRSGPAHVPPTPQAPPTPQGPPRPRSEPGPTHCRHVVGLRVFSLGLVSPRRIRHGAGAEDLSRGAAAALAAGPEYR